MTEKQEEYKHECTGSDTEACTCSPGDCPGCDDEKEPLHKWAEEICEEERNAELLEDGHGNIWRNFCYECATANGLEIVRPGKVQCRNCGK